MLNDACVHAMSRLNAFLTPRVLQPRPPEPFLSPPSVVMVPPPQTIAGHAETFCGCTLPPHSRSAPFSSRIRHRGRHRRSASIAGSYAHGQDAIAHLTAVLGHPSVSAAPLELRRHFPSATVDCLDGNRRAPARPLLQPASGTSRKNSKKGKGLSAKIVTHVNSAWRDLFGGICFSWKCRAFYANVFSFFLFFENVSSFENRYLMLGSSKSS